MNDPHPTYPFTTPTSTPNISVPDTSNGPLRTVQPVIPLPPPLPEHAAGVVQGRPVSRVPSPARRGRWQDNIDWHRAHPMEVRMYANVPHTTPGYLKRTYGMVAVGRNTRRRGTRVDLYMWYDPEREAVLKRT